MKWQPVSVVYIIDEEEWMRDSLALMLRSHRWLPETYPSAEAFVEMLDSRPDDEIQNSPSCLLLDVRLPGMSGLALFDQLIKRRLVKKMPVVFLAGHANVRIAVDAIKSGAFDFLQKPCSEAVLFDCVEQALAASAEELAAWHCNKPVRQRLAQLTSREQEIMRLLVNGQPNKLVAQALDLSIRTVEFHRANLLEKMEVKSVVELVSMLSAAQEEVIESEFVTCPGGSELLEA